MATAVSVELPARAVRKHLRKTRRASSAARPVTEVLQDLYIGLFGLVLVSVMVAPLARSALKDVVAHGGAGHVPHALVPDLGLALALVAAGTGLRALQLIGPVICDPARATWLLASPVSRSGLLGAAAGLAVVGTALSGAVAGLAVGLLLSWPAVGSAVVGGLVAALLSLLATTLQGRSWGAAWLRRTGDVLAALAVPVLVAGLVGVDAEPPSPSERTALLVALALGLLTAGCALGLRRALARLRRADLVAGTGLATGLRATVTALDGSFVAETLRLRRLLERGEVGSKPLRGNGFSALAWADVRRAWRARRGWLAAIAATTLVWAADDLYGRLGAALAMVLVAWAGAGAAAAGLRTISRSPALSRALPFTDADLRAAHLVVPGAVALVIGEIGCVLASRPGWWAVIATLLAVAGVLRTAGGRPDIRWELQATSPMGALPVGAVTAYLVGPDVVVLAALPFVFGADPLLSSLLPLLAVAVLLRRKSRRA
ncbi:DUF6297 family protein [Angustibacter sp. McL0619]|uniref:DUF6297 family protein n=1 Tax=Angustibacter sp. McL0619 TaxID=3415676 RepID=UPI003CECCFA6